MGTPDTDTWRRESLAVFKDEPSLMESFDQDVIEEYDRQQVYLDNTEYQREDITESCTNLGIYNDGNEKNLRVPGIPVNDSYFSLSTYNQNTVTTRPSSKLNAHESNSERKPDLNEFLRLYIGVWENLPASR